MYYANVENCLIFRRCGSVPTSKPRLRETSILNLFLRCREPEMQIYWKIGNTFQEILELEQQRALYLQSEEDKVTTYNCSDTDRKSLFLYNVLRHGFY